MKQNTLYLRALEPGDYEKFHAWHNDKKIYSRTMANKFYISRERDRSWIKDINDSPNSLYLAICLIENDQMIGTVSLINIDHLNRKAYIGGIILDQGHHGTLIPRIAFELFLEHVFLNMNINKLYSGYLETNLGSKLNLVNYGFKVEMKLREEVFKMGKYHDVLVSSLLASEFKIREEDDLQLIFSGRK